MKYVDFDFSELQQFIQKIENLADGGLKRELAIMLDGIGFKFLQILQDKIIELQVVDTRLLLHSFRKGSGPLYDKNGNYVGENIWTMQEGNLTLEVGSTVDYASYVNDGHWRVDPNNPKSFQLKDGTIARFVPGYLNDGIFTFDKHAHGGIVLKQKWVDGKHYWENALTVLEKWFPGYLENKLQQYLDNYF